MKSKKEGNYEISMLLKFDKLGHVFVLLLELLFRFSSSDEVVHLVSISIGLKFVKSFHQNF